jgi:hypothetical protein
VVAKIIHASFPFGPLGCYNYDRLFHTLGFLQAL